MTELVFPAHAGDERFKVTSLSGLERCTGPERLELYECAAPDLSPLRALRALRRLTVTWGSDMELASLMNERLLRDLEARGVEVEIEIEIEAAETVEAGRAPGPGDDFGDLNLRFVLLENLASRDLIPWPDPDRILRQTGKPDDNDGNDDPDAWMYVYNHDAAARLGAMVSDALLGLIVELEISPPLRLAMIVMPQWDGEDDQFDVERLDGLERCTKLQRLNLDNCRVTDLRPLLGLPALDRVRISWHPDIDRRAAAWAEDQRRNRRVIEKLEQRGVKIDVRW